MRELLAASTTRLKALIRSVTEAYLPIRVVLATGHPVLGMGLRQIIAEESAMAVVAILQDNADIVCRVRGIRPSVLVVDDRLLSAAVTIGAFVRGCPDTQVIILAENANQSSADQALMEGARGYISFQRSPAVLRVAIMALQYRKQYVAI